jgi:hypothetical protein
MLFTGLISITTLYRKEPPPAKFQLADHTTGTAHRGVKQDTHQIVEMGEPLQPVFDRKRFDLVERALCSFWLYVILEP